MDQFRPPQFFNWLLHIFCDEALLEEVEGDLLESFNIRADAKGLRRARWHYAREVLLLMRPSVLKKSFGIWSFRVTWDMSVGAIRLAFRQMKSDTITSLINIVGLGIALSASLLISLFVFKELRIDHQFEASDRIFRIVNDERPHSAEGRFLATVSPPMAPAIQQEFPEVEHAVRMRYADEVLLANENKQFYESRGFYADSAFLDVFSFPLIQGDRHTALKGPNRMIISPNMAKKYFGSADVIGRVLTMDGERMLEVTAIIDPLEDKTHFDFDFLISFETFQVPFGYPVTLESWGWISFHTYAKLRDATQADMVQDKFVDFAERHIFQDRPTRATFVLQPLEEIYFKSGDLMNMGEYRQGNLVYLSGLSLVALLILLVASFNFTNIRTAQSIKRVKEMGLRKVLGSRRHHIIYQGMLESAVVVVLALIIAVIALPLMKKWFLPNWNISMTLSPMDYLLWAGLLIILLLILVMLSSLYPSLLLAKITPTQLYKTISGKSKSRFDLRQGLVIFQFSITVGLIFYSLMIGRQMDFIRERELGFDKEHIIALRLQTDDFLERYEIAKDLWSGRPEIKSITAGDVFDQDYGSVPVRQKGMSEGMPMHLIGGYFNYFKTMGVELKEGRDFSTAHPSDTAIAIIINESAQEALGLDSPIGTALEVNTNIDGRVIGVTKDFHFYSLHDPIEPLVAVMPRTRLNQIILNIAAGTNFEKVIADLANDWPKISSTLPFDFTFLDEILQRTYQKDSEFSRLINFFTILTIIIAMLGLYGLISIHTNARFKEIGIRKVLGASVSHIYLLLSKDLLLLILMGSMVAAPFSIWFTKVWLQQFTYHTQPAYPLVLIVTLFTILMAMLVMSFQVVRAAHHHPSKILRDE